MEPWLYLYLFIVSCIVYALPALGGFLTAELIDKIDAFLRRAVPSVWGYTSQLYLLSELIV